MSHEPASVEVQRQLLLLERQVWLMALNGDSARHIADVTGLGEPHIRSIVALRTRVCKDPRCGVPQTGPGHPRKGWLQIKMGTERPWFCSVPCAQRWLADQATK
jgi:hypothetical protein